jgi:hypothetical protein
MSEKCRATTKRGTNCRAAAMAGSLYCVLHGDPKRAAELGRMGGRQNRHYVETEDVIISPPSNPQEITSILSQAMADVRARKLDPRIASTLTYMAGALLKAFETTEVHERLARLEADMQNKADKQ